MFYSMVAHRRYQDKTSAEARRGNIHYYIVTDIDGVGDKFAFRTIEKAAEFAWPDGAPNEDLCVVPCYGNIDDVDFEDDEPSDDTHCENCGDKLGKNEGRITEDNEALLLCWPCFDEREVLEKQQSVCQMRGRDEPRCHSDVFLCGFNKDQQRPGCVCMGKD
jgi:hypothetical protein